jgi:hypothetical protein
LGPFDSEGVRQTVLSETILSETVLVLDGCLNCGTADR